MAAAAQIRPVLPEASNSRARAFGQNPEFDLLLACCANSSDELSDDRIRDILSHPLDWDRMLRFVDHHRVVPQVYGALSARSHLLPAQTLRALRLRYQDNACKTLWFTAELARIVTHLESAGIKVLPYKGPTLAETLYGEVTRRQFGDLDVLIRPEDVTKAKAALRDLGYKTEIDLAPHIEKAYVDTGYEYSFSSAQGSNLLELQWRILPRFYSIDFNVADLFERADEISLGGDSIVTQPPQKKWNRHLQKSREAAAEYSPRRQPWVESGTLPSPSGAKDRPRYSLGCPMRTLRPEDLLLVLCVHAAKHVWVQLSWLCDIAQLAKSQNLNWNAIQHEAKRLGIERILNLNLFLAHKLLGSTMPPATHSQPNCHSEHNEESEVAGNGENADSSPQTRSFEEDRLTTALADEIPPIIQSSTHYDTESLLYFRLMMRLRERRQDQARFLWRLTVTPSVSEWSTVRLPKRLHTLYRLVRLSRLAKRLVVARLGSLRILSCLRYSRL